MGKPKHERALADTQAMAMARLLRTSPRKLNLVAQLIRGLKASLKPGGVYLMQDIGGSARLENNLDFPMASFLYAISCAHCTPVSLGQGGEGLGTMWGWETAEGMLRDAGFANVNRHILTHDPMNVWFVATA